MKPQRLFILFLSLMAVVSCAHHVQSRKYVIPYVTKIMADTSAAEHKVLTRGVDNADRGSIAVIGAAEDVVRITESLLLHDLHDNISGRETPDGLPDFAGESFASIYDLANDPYEGYFSVGNDEFLNELNVRAFVKAVDTLALNSTIFTERRGYKQRSKIVIYASSYASAYGFTEVDTLCKTLAPNVVVFAPVQAMTHYVGRHLKGNANVAVWSDHNKIDKGIYSTVIPEVLKEYPELKLNYQAFAPPEYEYMEDTDTKSSLVHFLDMYSSANGDAKLSAILIDNELVLLEEMREAVREIMTTEDSEYLNYRTLLSKDFVIIDAGEALSEQCYEYMRKANVFTHKIAYPDMKCYFTAALPNLDGAVYEDDWHFSQDTKYNRKPNQDFLTFSLVELSERYFPASLMYMMESEAPKSYSIYVR